MFITLEGGEGAGKSTQARLLVAALTSASIPAMFTREPGGAPGAELLRGLLLSRSHDWSAEAEIYLHFAARSEHLARTILPALEAGTVVVCDRFADSTMAYQGYGLGADRTLIAALTRLLPRQPDLTLMLQVSPQVAAVRLAERHQALDRYESMDPAFHARVAQGFAAIAATEPGRCVAIPADGAAEDVHQAICLAVAVHVPGLA